MGDDVDRVGQPHNRVADELTRTVPGDLAAPVDVDDGGSVEGPLMRLGAPAGRVDRRVLEEEDGVRDLACDDLRVDLALHLPGGQVFDGVAPEADLPDFEAESRGSGHAPSLDP
ncbi:unannotated protein [freshwater metagenome]|uniref:Unannotated protein n=1 Tax=freshwater metagenome TaxID=449393 RepID=A0A6J7LNB5_9ZZZZ